MDIARLTPPQAPGRIAPVSLPAQPLRNTPDRRCELVLAAFAAPDETDCVLEPYLDRMGASR